jgi:terminase small subunit-like protein
MSDDPRRRPRQTYTPELADQICALIAEGHSLRTIIEMPGMPCRRVVLYWLYDHQDFRDKYEIARMLQAEVWSHEILEIADDSAGDFIINERGERVADHENINRARLRVDSRKWLLSKLLPKKYGDRVTADVTVHGHEAALAELEEAERRMSGERHGLPH